MIGERELNRILGPRVELGGGIQELKRYQPAVVVEWLGVHHGSVDCPDRSRDEKGIDRIGTEDLDRRINAAACAAANLDTGYSPALRRERLGCRFRDYGARDGHDDQKDGKEGNRIVNLRDCGVACIPV